MILWTPGQCYCFTLLGSALVPIAGEDIFKKKFKEGRVHFSLKATVCHHSGEDMVADSSFPPKPMSLTSLFVPAYRDSVVFDKKGTEWSVPACRTWPSSGSSLPNAIASTVQEKEAFLHLWPCCHRQALDMWVDRHTPTHHEILFNLLKRHLDTIHHGRQETEARAAASWWWWVRKQSARDRGGTKTFKGYPGDQPDPIS